MLFSSVSSIAEVKSDEYISKELSKFITELYDTLRIADSFSDLYIACLKKDNDWFEKQDSPTKTLQFCEMHLNFIKRDLKPKYEAMVDSLAISTFEYYGDSRPTFNLENLNYLIENNFASHYLSPTVKHPYKGFAKIPDLDENDLKRATQRVHNDLQQRVFWLNEEDLDTSNLTFNCVRDSPLTYMFTGTSCYYESYKNLIFGSDEYSIKPTPLLAFIQSATPSDLELANAIEKIKEKNAKIRKEFKEKYLVEHSDGSIKVKDQLWTIDNNLDLFLFRSFTEKYTERNPSFNWFVEEAENKIKNRQWLKTGTEIGLSLIIYFGCDFATKRLKLFIKISCIAPLMLANQNLFLFFDTKLLNHIIDLSVYRADRAKSIGANVELLSELEFKAHFRKELIPYTLGFPLKALIGIALSNHFIDY